MKNKYILFIGLNDKDKHRQLIKRGQAIKLISDDLMSEKIDGATFNNAIGLYKGEKERSLKVEIYNASESNIIKAIKRIKKSLNQETIILEKVIDNSLFL